MNDLSTSLLMGRFYRELCQDGEFRSAAVALRAAQQWLRKLNLDDVRSLLLELMANPNIPDEVQNLLLN